jgi:predicted dehydrogenase
MPVKYGVIGCGAIAQRRHIPECVANPDSKLVAVADPNQARAEEIGRKFGARSFIDYRQLLKAADIDAVVICGPNHLHAEQALAALKAARHVLVEKPMATTRQDAKAMIQAAHKAGKYLMVGQNQRLMPAHVKAKAILNSGVLGKPLSFRTSFKHPGPEGWSIDGAKGFFFQRDQAVMGATGDLGVHKADLMRWLLGEEFTRVGGMITTRDKRDASGKLIALDDTACLTLRTQSGVVGSIEVNWINYGGEDNQTILYCEKGTISIGTDPVYNVIVHHRNGDREMHKVGEMATNNRQVASGVIDALTRSILTQTPPAIDGMEGYRSLEVILTAMEAAAAGKTLKIPV